MHYFSEGFVQLPMVKTLRTLEACNWYLEQQHEFPDHHVSAWGPSWYLMFEILCGTDCSVFLVRVPCVFLCMDAVFCLALGIVCTERDLLILASAKWTAFLLVLKYRTIGETCVQLFVHLVCVSVAGLATCWVSIVTLSFYKMDQPTLWSENVYLYTLVSLHWTNPSCLACEGTWGVGT